MKKTLIVLLLLILSLQVIACNKTNTSQDDIESTNEEVVEETISPEEDVMWQQIFADKEDRENLITKITKFDVTSDNRISITYDGVEREGLIFFPENVKGSPLLVMLHGSGMSMEEFIDMIKINDEATARGYTVLYLQGKTNPDDKTSVIQWNNGTSLNSNDDLGFIQAAALKAEEKYELDAYRTYVAGFSNGAFMVHTIAAEGNSTFEGFCSVAGDMQEHSWESKKEYIELSFLEIFGLKDDAVPSNAAGTAKFAQAPAIEDVMNYYGNVQKLTLHDPVSLSDKVIEYTYDSQESEFKVQCVAIKDCHHGWPEERLTTLNTNKYILDFFDSLNK